MNCKCCGYPHYGQSILCPVCGERIDASPLGLPAPKKSHSRFPYLLLIALLLAGIVLFFLIPMDTSVTEDAPSLPDSVPGQTKALFQKECFILEDGVLTFDESKFNANPILIVPAAIEQQPVQVIGEGCFENLEGVTTVILPSSVTMICDRAFAGCSDLRGVCVPNAVTAIGEDAFRDCTSLEAVYLPTGLSAIGTGAFENCHKLIYIFYNGFYEQWQILYNEVITPFTWVIAWDGEYRHTGKTG